MRWWTLLALAAAIVGVGVLVLSEPTTQPKAGETARADGNAEQVGDEKHVLDPGRGGIGPKGAQAPAWAPSAAGDGVTNSGGTTSRPPGCISDEECGPWERCALGECVDGRRTCKDDADCGPRARCVLGACLDGIRECPEPGCKAGFHCVFGRCSRDEDVQCKEDADCGAGRRCVLERCIDGARDCTRDLDCAPDSRCVFERCVEGKRVCAVDRDCGEGSRCTFGACAEGARECTRDDECTPGQRCYFGICAD
jgi:Cys-rich repeat protein